MTVCQLCADGVEKYFPHFSVGERNELLMGATGFPFVSGEQVVKQLADHVAHGVTTLGEACARADMLVEADMREWHLRSAFIGWGWEPKI